MGASWGRDRDWAPAAAVCVAEVGGVCAQREREGRPAAGSGERG